MFMFRNPKTLNEKKKNADPELKIRAKRKPSNLVSDWDDLTNNAYKDRSWKNRQKRQTRARA
jgi:hypothetical protein